MTPTQPMPATETTDQADRRRRRALVFWVIGSLLVGGAVGAGVTSLLDDSSTSSQGGSTSGTTATVAPAPTAAAPTAPPPAPAPASIPAPSPCTTPQACAQALYDAWKHNDQAAAAQVADPAAVTKMFSSPYVPLQTNNGPVDPYQTGPVCQGAAGSVICTWDGQDLELQMKVRNNTGGLPIRVVEVRLFEGAPLHEV